MLRNCMGEFLIILKHFKIHLIISVWLDHLCIGVI